MHACWLQSLSKNQAASILKQLVATNFIYQNNRLLAGEISKRLKIWS